MIPELKVTGRVLSLSQSTLARNPQLLGAGVPKGVPHPRGDVPVIASVEAVQPSRPHSFIIPGPPIAAPRMTQRDKWLKPPRPCVAVYWDYRRRIQIVVSARLDVPLSVRLHFFVSLPESWSKAKRHHMNGMPCRTKPDLDNYIKAVLDGLWSRDSAIASIEAHKTWCLENPRTEIEIIS